MLIFAVDDSPILDADTLLRVAQAEFGADYARLTHSDSPYLDFQVQIEPPDAPSFRIGRAPDGSLNTDGTEAQGTRVAAAVRAALPEDYPRVVAVTVGASTYVDLVPGITPEMIRNRCRDVSEGGFENL